jgi:hypothetical protein
MYAALILVTVTHGWYWRPVRASDKAQCSVGSWVLPLFGVSVQTGVMMLEDINQLRAR